MGSSNYLPLIDPLRERELQILRCLSRGLSNREIAQEMVISQDTVKWYNKQIFRKLGVNSRTKAVAQAKNAGLLERDSESEYKGDYLTKHNLPAQITSFVGREWEIREIIRLLSKSRLITLTGAGGSGKTRLAIEVASQVLPAFRDGIWVVELSKLREPSKVPETITSTLNIEIRSGEPPIENLKRYLRRKQLLLVLDNFEHLLPAGIYISELLEEAPQLSVITTSREKLHIYGEHEFPVLPLVVPGTDHRQTADQLRAFDAVQLFFDRARAVQPGFELTNESLPNVARICIMLDGLPLAIELCAPLVKVFSAAEIVRHLDENLVSLPLGPRDLPSRQRTMRAALEWSTDILESDEKLLFERMAVFQGGGTMLAVEKICATGLSGNFINKLTSLVDRNLVINREARAGEMRFYLLAVVRELNLERLRHTDEFDLTHRLHATFYARLVEKAFSGFCTPRHSYWFSLLRDETDNIRSALSWSLSKSEPELSLRIVAGLRDYWAYYGLSAEGRQYADKALEDAAQSPAELRAGALMAAGNFCFYLNDLEGARSYILQSLDLYNKLGDELNTAWCKILLSDTYLESPAQVKRGQDYAQQALTYFRDFSDLAGMSRAHNMLGELYRMEGDYDSAQYHYDTCLQLCKQTGEKLRESFQYVNLGLVAYYKQEFLRSVHLHQKGLEILFEMDTVLGMATHLAALAGPIASLGHPRWAARMLGAADVQLESLGVVQQTVDQMEIELYVDQVKSALGEQGYRQAWEEGSLMTIREAVREVLEEKFDE